MNRPEGVGRNKERRCAWGGDMQVSTAAAYYRKNQLSLLS